MIIIPIGHEQTEVRRTPWITLALIAACTGFFVQTWLELGALDAQIQAQAEEAFEYYLQHPYLELDAEADDLIFGGSDAELRETLMEAALLVVLEPRLNYQQEVEQPELDALAEDLLSARDAHPFFQYGLIPDAPTKLGWFAHMFMHAGWLHLLGNMLLLYLAGSVIEDVWGRPLFLALYATSGLAAAAFFQQQYPDLATPLVGASGAVSGVMGAFLVRYFNVRIRFWYWFMFVFVGTFAAPAWLMLPLWFGNEWFSAWMLDQAMPGGTAGVAHWAHVGGFVYGALAGIVLRVLKVEQRFLHARLEAKVTVKANPTLDEAARLREDGKVDEAFTVLETEVKRNPRNYDATVTLWDVATELGRASEVAPVFARLIRQDVQGGSIDLALAHLKELNLRAPETGADRRALARLAGSLVAADRADDATFVIETVVGTDEAPLPCAVALRLARATKSVHAGLAGRVARCGLASADVEPDARAELEALAAKAPPLPAARAAPVEFAEANDGPMTIEATSFAEEAPSAEPDTLDDIGLDGLDPDTLDEAALEAHKRSEPPASASASASGSDTATPFELGSTFDLTEDEEEGAAGFLADADPDDKPSD